jgi:hypothetical protein
MCSHTCCSRPHILSFVIHSFELFIFSLFRLPLPGWQTFYLYPDRQLRGPWRTSSMEASGSGVIYHAAGTKKSSWGKNKRFYVEVIAKRVDKRYQEQQLQELVLHALVSEHRYLPAHLLRLEQPLLRLRRLPRQRRPLCHQADVSHDHTKADYTRLAGLPSIDFPYGWRGGHVQRQVYPRRARILTYAQASSASRPPRGAVRMRTREMASYLSLSAVCWQLNPCLALV